MYLKFQNHETLRRLSEGDEAFTDVRISAPYNAKIPYNITADLKLFCDFFAKPNFIVNLTLANLQLNKIQILAFARGIHNSKTLLSLTLKNIKRIEGGFWYITNAIRYNISIKQLILEKMKFRQYDYEMITKMLLENKNIEGLAIINGTSMKKSLDHFCNFISASSNLKYLNFTGHRLRDYEVDQLMKAININNCVTMLELPYNHISILFDFRQLLRLNKSITYINLIHNPLSISGLEDLIKIINSNKIIHTLKIGGIEGDRIIEDFRCTIGYLTNSSCLSRLTWCDQDFLGNEVGPFEYLFRSNRVLQRVSFAHRQGPQAYIHKLGDYLTNAYHLTQLDLSGILHSDGDFDLLTYWIGNSQTLKFLRMRKADLTSSSLSYINSAIKVNKALTHLDIGDNYIGTVGALKLAKALLENQSLLSLEIDKNYMGDAGLSSLIDAIQSKPYFQALSITDNFFGAKGLYHCISILKKNPLINMIYYGYILQGEMGAELIKNILIASPAINTIKFKCRMGKKRIYGLLDDKDIAALSEALVGNQSINQLYFLGMPISNLSIRNLIDAFNDGYPLQELALIGCQLELPVLNSLYKWLKERSHLKKLNLSKNHNLRECIEFFTDLLVDNNRLIELKIADCFLEYEQITALFKSLRYNNTLKRIDIAQNWCKGNVSAMYGDIISQNCTLTHLLLSRVYNYDIFEAELSLLLENNFSLVFCKSIRGSDLSFHAIMRNRANKNIALLLLKEYVYCHYVAAEEYNFYWVFQIQKDVFYYLLKFIYPPMSDLLCENKSEEFKKASKESHYSIDDNNATSRTRPRHRFFYEACSLTTDIIVYPKSHEHTMNPLTLP